MSENSPAFERLRSLAENILKSRSADDQLASDAEFKEVLHELQVYQIELEIQNEELRQAQNELAASRREFSDLFEHAPVAYFTVDEEGVIVKANSTAASKFDRTQSELQGLPFVQLIESDMRDKFYFHHRNLLKSRKPQSGEFRFIQPRDRRFYGQLESILVDPENGNNTFRAAVVDVTQRKSYEERLQALRELDQALLISPSADEITEMVLDTLLSLTPSCYACFVDFRTGDDASASLLFKQDEQRIFKTLPLYFEEFAAFQDMSNRDFHIAPAAPGIESIVSIHLDAHLIVPIFQSQDQVGIIVTGTKTESDYSQDTIRVVQDIALRMGIALKQAEMHARIQQYAYNLEIQVQERTAELRQSEHNEREQRTFAEAMLDIVQHLNRSLDLDIVLEHILNSLERVIDFDNASIVLVDEQTGKIIKTATRNQHPAETWHEPAQNITDFPAYQAMARTQKPVFIPDVTTSPDWLLARGYEDIKSYIGMPIIVDNVVLGFLNVDKYEQGYLHQEQFKHLHAFAAQAAIAIKNAHAHQREQQLAVLEERQRLARELHDAVSQNLFSISIIVQSLSSQLRSAPYEIDKIRDIFLQIEKIASGAQAEMRLLLLELRPANMEETRLEELLKQLITGLRGRKNIEVAVDLMPMPVLPFDFKLMLYRMAQEALNNISKHANANHVSIQLSITGKNLVLVIKDDGRGFSIDGSHHGHGLTILHERADKIGAHLTIDSTVGKGTIVQVTAALPEES